MCQCTPLNFNAAYCGKKGCESPEVFIAANKLYNQIKKMEKNILLSLANYVGDIHHNGFKIISDVEVPPNEVWFIDSSGEKFALKNVKPSVTFTHRNAGDLEIKNRTAFVDIKLEKLIGKE